MRNKGFTLVELMVVIAIVGILALVAMPSFTSLISSTRVSSQANDLVAALGITRSEAVKRNAQVQLCPSSDGATCSAGTDWSSGWLVRVVSDGSILRVYPALTSGNTLTAGSTAFVTYLSNGQTLQAETFNLCGSGGTQSRSISISVSGRVKSSNPGTC
ncbi:MAG: GspH/FimT family pseudopilin [Bacteroidota bacterium]